MHTCTLSHTSCLSIGLCMLTKLDWQEAMYARCVATNYVALCLRGEHFRPFARAWLVRINQTIVQP